MAQPAIGGEGRRVRTLYHYSKHPVRTPILPGNYWTEFRSENPEHVSQFAGKEAERFVYRSEARVNEEQIDGSDPWFINRATKIVDGLGHAFEYTNEKPVLPIFVVYEKMTGG